MHVKKFTAKNIKEALRLVKKELGADAIIISTRDIDPVSNNGKAHAVEVTAAMDFNCDEMPEIKGLIYPLKKEIAELKEIIKSISPDLLSSNKKNNDNSSNKEAVELKSIVHYLLNNTKILKDLGINDSLINLHREAIDKGINERLAFQLIEKVNSRTINKPSLNNNVKAQFFKEMEKFIKTAGPLRTSVKKPKVVSFVGPTGVGKTTTIAKLAAELSLNQKKEVALLTLDTYRIAAIEQLKIYSKIIDIPLSIARDKKEFQEALQLYKDKDIVLIDTAGSSRKDEKQMKELMDFLKGDVSVETHLVLSSTDQEDILFSNIKRFYPLSVDRLIFTKLDEANSFGMLFNIAMKTNKAISYFTTGQKVPEDIEVATAEKTIDLIFQ
ncbi:MAG TPA: flagellar biosynthesis protein FlhF [Nitrospinota bacterium]|jgi:flagellar biosynthesis protein FlhF|nr:flagellar biosynthesis protein FlhF [Nitrospinota bacterium]